MLTYAVHPHHHHVVLIQEIPSLMGCSRHRGPSRLRGVPKVSGRKGLGMVSILPRDLISSRYVLTLYCKVALCILAVPLGMDRRPLHPLAGPRCQRHAGMEDPNRRMLHCQVSYPLIRANTETPQLTETLSLHATPMWLIALYVPAMAPVNYYWIPPQW